MFAAGVKQVAGGGDGGGGRWPARWSESVSVGETVQRVWLGGNGDGCYSSD